MVSHRGHESGKQATVWFDQVRLGLINRLDPVTRWGVQVPALSTVVAIGGSQACLVSGRAVWSDSALS